MLDTRPDEKLHTESQLQASLDRFQRLEESEPDFRSLFDAVSDGLVISSLDGVIVEANPAFCAMHGYTREELIGSTLARLVSPGFERRFFQHFKLPGSGRSFHVQAKFRRRDGSRFLADTRGGPFSFKGSQHVFAVVRDITEQVEAYALLEQRVEEKTHELSALLEVANQVASTLELEPLLRLILQQLKLLVGCCSASIFTLEGGSLHLLDYEVPQELAHSMRELVTLERAKAHRRVVTGKQPVIVDDIMEDSEQAREYCEYLGYLTGWGSDEIRENPSKTGVLSWMGVPMTVKGRVIGMLSIGFSQPGCCTPEKVGLASAIASHAAVAMANARLYARAQELAAHEERQRLARELHDSVSQALYGIELGAQTARELLSLDGHDEASLKESLTEPLDYVLALAGAGLTEMRALIFELRPESLEIEGLVAGLGKQVSALRARQGLEVEACLCEEPDVPLAIKEAVFRIAREALHNTVKHARARHVKLQLAYETAVITLAVQDDGSGFDPAQPFPGHLGLRSMSERAERLGGTLQISSHPGQGTRITLAVPVQPPQTGTTI